MILRPKYGKILRTTDEYFTVVTGEDWTKDEAVCSFVDTILEKDPGECYRQSMYCDKSSLLNVYVWMDYYNDTLNIRLKTHDAETAEEWGLPLVAEAQAYPHRH